MRGNGDTIRVSAGWAKKLTVLDNNKFVNCWYKFKIDLYLCDVILIRNLYIHGNGNKIASCIERQGRSRISSKMGGAKVLQNQGRSSGELSRMEGLF
jgi:hypothetical protein